jgi:uncharacterized repeat protein (TIGR03803 family)
MLGKHFESSFESADSRRINRECKLWSAALFASWLMMTGASGDVVFTNLYSFTGGTDGAFPWSPLMQASDGNLYGTTEYGGARSSISGYGTTFQLPLGGAFNPLYYFDNNGDGDHPFYSGLTEGSDGFFYGTTDVGGDDHDGVIFAMSSDGFLFPIYSFLASGDDGVGPLAGVVLGSDGNFYGTTQNGGSNSFGTIFQLTSDWNYTNLFSFNGTNGAGPTSALVQGNDGNLYGTTFNGGTAFHGLDTSGNPTGYGTVFKLSTNGAFLSLFSFGGTNGSQPVAGLITGQKGNLYGTTELGGANGYGTVFRINTNGAFTLLFSFGAGRNGAYPTGRLVEGSDGNFYGTTADIPFAGGGSSVGSGTVFRITPTGGFTKLYSFPGRPGGVEPVAGLTQASDGNFYGTCMGGPNGVGMVFQISIPVAPVLQGAQKTSGGFSFSWSAVAGQNYQPQYKTNLSSKTWIDLGSSVTSTNGMMSISNSVASDPSRFYRVILLQ